MLHSRVVHALAGTVFGVTLLLPAVSAAHPIVWRLGLAAVDRATSFAAAGAAAHTLGGTGSPGSGATWDGSLVGASVHVSRIDQFSHPFPPGEDFARAEAHASGQGLFGEARTETVTRKGDFALAAAFAKGGWRRSSSGNVSVFGLSLGAGTGPFAVGAAADPGIGRYRFAITDLDPEILNENVALDPLKTLVQQAGYQFGTPATVYYSLNIDFNAETSQFSIESWVNPLFVTRGRALVPSDFSLGTIIDTDSQGNPLVRPCVQLNDSSLLDVEFTIPADASLNFSLDAMQWEEATPSPGSLALIGAGAVVLFCSRRRVAGR